MEDMLKMTALDGNIIMIILEFLNRDITTYMQPESSDASYVFSVQLMRASPPFRHRYLEGWLAEGAIAEARFAPCNWTAVFGVVNMLRVMQKMTKDAALSSLFLVKVKAHVMLKKFLRFPQRDLKLYAIKILKHILPLTGKRWRLSKLHAEAN